MVTKVKLESTVLYIIPIFVETLEVCGFIYKKKVEIRILIKLSALTSYIQCQSLTFPLCIHMLSTMCCLL
jgi:hypothetical protein